MKNGELKIANDRLTHTGKLRKNNAITLIALVITIIILLLIAGISIYALTQTGLLERAKEAKEKSENAQIQENKILLDYEEKIGKINGSNREESNYTMLGIPVTKGNGIKEDPYIITDALQLKAISLLQNTENLYIKLGNDIDLSKICYQVDGTTANDISWNPIGSISNPFQGTLDGDGHKISNIYINSTESNQGLFSCIGEKATIQNLTIDGNIQAQGGYIGGFVGINYGTIEKCINDISISNTNAYGYYTGGITGHNLGIIYRCRNKKNITSAGETAGGIAGVNVGRDGTGFIIECINNGNIHCNSYCTGGITSANANFSINANGYICNSYNTGTITGGVNKRAGIAGQIKYNGGNTYIYNCYNKGDIQGCPDITGWDGGNGTSTVLNSYGVSQATVEKLNTKSDIESALKDTNLYRENAWKLKDGNIVLDWE